MKKGKFLRGVPGYALALMTMIFGIIVSMVVSDLVYSIFKIPESKSELVLYITYMLIIATACFFFCRREPESWWYVPVLTNLLGIIAAIVEPNFWRTPMWIILCGGWLASVAAALLGSYLGKRRAKN